MYFHITTQLWLVGVIMLTQLCSISLLFCHEETAEQILSQNFTVLADTWAFPGLVYTPPLHSGACKCSVLHCPTETKARTRAGRNRPPFTPLPCLTHSEWNQAIWAPTCLSEQTPFQKWCSQVNNCPSKLLKPSRVCSVRCTSLTPCPSNLFSFWNFTAQLPALQRDTSCKGSNEQQCTSREPHKPCM